MDDDLSSDEDLPRIDISTGSTTNGSSHPWQKTYRREEKDEAVVILGDSSGSSLSPSGEGPSSRADLAAPVEIRAERLCEEEDYGNTESLQHRIARNRAEALTRRKASEERRQQKEEQLAEKERAKLVRAQEREDKKRQKEVDRALKAAAKESSKEQSPAERMKNMVVLLDSTLVENSDFMAEFAPAIQSMKGNFRVSQCDSEPGVVKWIRILTECDVDANAHVTRRNMEIEENEVLVTMEAQGFAGLVHYSKQDLLDQDLPEGAITLEQYVDNLYNSYPGSRVSLAIEGIEAFFRGHKTRVNRQFRDAVRSAGDSSHAPSRGRKKVPTESMFADVSRVDCEEAMVRLQLRNGCMTRMCEGGVQLAQHVLSLTRAICDAHYKKENPFSFYVESGQGPSKKELDEAGENKVALIWKHQLMQFNNVSVNMAAAVVAAYPSPAHLLQAYERCSDREEAERLLKDIVIRRGVGVVSTSRKLGPVQSKRIHTMMTSDDPTLLLS